MSVRADMNACTHHVQTPVDECALCQCGGTLTPPSSVNRVDVQPHPQGQMCAQVRARRGGNVWLHERTIHIDTHGNTHAAAHYQCTHRRTSADVLHTCTRSLPLQHPTTATRCAYAAPTLANTVVYSTVGERVLCTHTNDTAIINDGIANKTHSIIDILLVLSPINNKHV